MRCEDCVHEKVCEGYSNCEEAGLCEPKRPHGKWIKKTDGLPHLVKVVWFVCSECGVQKSEETTFCPNCGADMRKEGDAE